MKLIIEVGHDGQTFAYTETERVFKRNERVRKNRDAERVLNSHLRKECDLGSYVRSTDRYFVFDINANKAW